MPHKTIPSILLRKGGIILLHVLLCFLFLPLLLNAQEKVILKGRLLDASTQEAIESASIYFEQIKGRVGTVTDKFGYFKLIIPPKLQNNDSLSLHISYVGYTPLTLRVSTMCTYDCGDILLHPFDQLLETIVVTPERRSKRGKEDPTSLLLRQIIKNKGQNRLPQQGTYSYQVYEKMLLAKLKTSSKDKFGNIDPKIDKTWQEPSLFYNLYSTPFSLRERSIVYAQRDGVPLPANEIGRRFFGLEEVIDEGVLSNVLYELMDHVDPYADNIYLFTQQFPSPIHQLFAHSFYQFAITDTTDIQGTPCFQLAFSPRHPREAGFTGSIWIDTLSYGIRHMQMELSSLANVNWVDRLRISMEFAPLYSTQGALWLPTRQTIQASIRPIDFSAQGIEGYIDRVYTNYHFGENALQPELLEPRKRLPEALYQRSLEQHRGSYGWIERSHPLTDREQKAIDLANYLHTHRTYRWIGQLSHALYTGFVPITTNGLWNGKNLLDFGPVGSLVGLNQLEGVRLRLGGTTTANLWPHCFIEGYGAYGTRDEKWKYYLRATYSFDKRRYHSNEYPLKNLSLYTHHDLFIPGREASTLYRDGILSSIGSYTVQTRFYGHKFGVEYRHDFSPRFGSTLSWEYMNATPTGKLNYYRYNSSGELENVFSSQYSSLNMDFTYRPKGTAFHPRRSDEFIDLESFKPRFSLGLRLYPPVLADNLSFYASLTLDCRHRLQLSRLGFVDLILKGGMLFGTPPQTLFFTPTANHSWLLFEDEFQTLRSLEYIADQFAEFRSTYHMNGLILNRIPWINRLKFREVLTLHGYWGHTRSQNRGIRAGVLMIQNEQTLPMNNHLHLEMGIGLENILTLGRIDVYFPLNSKISSRIQEAVLRLNLSIFF